MEIPKGFKKTEVGIIPDDWDIKKIGDCLLRNPDYGINAAAVPYNESLPVYLRITDIAEDGKYSRKNLVSVNNLSSDSYYLQEGDLVFARTGASVGKTYLYNKNDGKLVFAGFLIRVKTNEKILLPDYLKYFTQTKIYWNWIAANSMRTGQPGINGNEYKELFIPLPPTKAEQAAIAEALNDADALMTELEKLIAKKKAIKQGTMQELLKPKEGWVVKSLRELDFDISDGNYSSKYPKSSEFIDIGIPFIRANNIKNMNIIDDDMRFISPQLHGELLKGHLKRDDILITTRGEIGKIAIVPEKHIGSNINAQIVRINSNQKFQKHYLAYFLIKKETQEYLLNHQTGSALKQLPVGALKELPISFPKIEEQNHIGMFLSDMEAEIAALEKKLDKYKMLKQGMMQKLLTGKIRLMVNC